MNARAQPSTLQLNRNLQANEPAEVLADVKDFRGKVSKVRLKFQDVPITIPMENVAGTTWRAELTPRQIQMLAVAGKSISYEANVIAQNDQGQVSQSTSPVRITIKTPDISQNVG